MAFIPDQIDPETLVALVEVSQEPKNWTPLFSHKCSFPPEIFREVMLNLIRNPNLNSNFLFRADISSDSLYTPELKSNAEIIPRLAHFEGFTLQVVMVRTLIPRNPHVDESLDQTCLIYTRLGQLGDVDSLVIYLPHASSAAEVPYYHPAVHGIGFLHTYSPKTQEGLISLHYSFFDSEPRSDKLERTAQRLLAVLHKHGQGQAAGYIKRVNHDVILPQAIVQNTYARLKAKYAKELINGWVEDTDPGKHVFEDLSIAAFLIELWAEMYKEEGFPGFVDIGCGNGLLVHILLEEGYSGWGFDARRRKSWATYSLKTQENLKERVLIPSIIQTTSSSICETDIEPPSCESSTSHIQETTNTNNVLDIKLSSCELSTSDVQETIGPKITTTSNNTPSKDPQNIQFHNGIFPKGTFIVSNHADELTPWTPILAHISSSPFIAIPCCSHALSGARFRAPNIKSGNKTTSAYASLVAWVTILAQDCGWEVEKEMLRIPSTRNTALIGRRRLTGFQQIDILALLNQYGGAVGWEENAFKLCSATATRGH